MKKLKLLFIPLVGLAAFMGVWLSGTNNVSAANNEACQATWLRDNIVKKVTVDTNGNTSILTNNSGYNLDYKFIPDGNEGAAITGRINNGASINLTVTNGGAIIFYLVDDINDSCTATAGSEVGISQINASGLVSNPLYNDSICVNYRNKWGNNETMKNAVPYCYSATTYGVYSREQVQGWINTAEALYESINSGTNTDITIDDSYQEVKDVTKTDKLVCNAFSNNNYETMHKYYHVETETVDNCAVTCKEEIEVNFSDPVATQPGMCFQYLIEIKSKVVCDGNYTAPPPTRKQACYPTPQCASGTYSGTVGGPNEDFDSCVQSCDGGRYTQKCIDSCYNEVYENNSKIVKSSSDEKLTKEDVIALSPFNNSNESFYEAVKLANGCPGTSNAQALYEYMQRNPGGYYSGGKWYSSHENSSICSLAPYYFRSLEQTKQTIALNKGDISYSGIGKGYFNYGDGILRENYGSTYCDDTCYWVGSCPSDAPLTETIAQEQYEKEVQEYMSKKQACEQKAATCTNETTDYKMVVDNLDPNDSKDDEDKSDWQEDFTSSQKLNSTNVTGKFPSMVILTDGSCEDGEDDPWNYHNIITFPGAWINNKTGQIVHSIQPGHEDFYTYIGNQYCTKLNSVPVNTAWYDWKVNQNGDPSALTDSEKEQIEKNLDMNIRGHIDNYGYFGWDFDISCFYAIDTPTNNPDGCSPDNADWPDCDGGSGGTDGNYETPVNDYKFRAVALDNLFPNSVTQTSSGDMSKNTRASTLINEVESLRNNNAVNVADTNTRPVGFNWTCGATNLENKDYIIQPVSLINQIQTLGDSIYEGDEYLDYHIRLTPKTMNKVRNYNKKYDSYTEPVSNNSNEVLTAGNKKTSGITVYRSYLLHKVLNSDELLKSGLIGCNNEDNGTCPNTIDKSTACYNEYMAQSSVLKGAK